MRYHLQVKEIKVHLPQLRAFELMTGLLVSLKDREGEGKGPLPLLLCSQDVKHPLEAPLHPS